MIDALKRTLVAVKDLNEQPDSKFVLVAGAGGTRYYAVDSYGVMQDTVAFFREGSTLPVFVCKIDGTWSLVRRDVIDLVTEEEVLRSSKNDHDALEKLHGELHPGEKDASKDAGVGVYL